MSDLEERIQSLAQELQDMILDQTLITSVSLEQKRGKHGEVLLDSDYKFPWQLQVDGRSREALARAYYGTFVFDVDTSCRGGNLLPEIWLFQMPKSHVQLIAELRLHGSWYPKYCSLTKGIQGLSAIKKWLKRHFGIEIGAGVFRIEDRAVSVSDHCGDDSVRWCTAGEAAKRLERDPIS